MDLLLFVVFDTFVRRGDVEEVVTQDVSFRKEP